MMSPVCGARFIAPREDFRFDKHGAGLDTTFDIAMAARGETLLIAAPLGGLTYVEIDSLARP
jgi:hypothetical protein